ncbi:MAG TPA: aspartate aminotransferase family protein [Fibrobacteria bacterium]|nr:aspartate aminotransferase family protein [Fibrobacteria bacterium]HOX52717.1 aspartate aminotransferase family protein [Fibrobacteria bacterium]
MPSKSDNATWAQRGRTAWMGGALRPDLCLVSGSGAWVRDAEGRDYLDFVGGWAVASLGHAPQAVAKAVASQAATLLHCSPGFWNPPAVELAERLAALTGFGKVFLGCTGAEANECAIKLARKRGAPRGAWKVVTTLDGFHGRTLATMAATGKPHWQGLFGPPMPGFVHIPFNDVAALEREMDDTVCAVMFEPVQGEGGVVPATAAFARAARTLCDRHGALLVADEVQTGLGRCGSILAHRDLGIEADVATFAKGLGAGFPVSACLTHGELDVFQPGDQGGTHTYHPLGAAAGLAVLEEIERLDLCARSREAGASVAKVVEDLSSANGLTDLRGSGLLRAFDLPSTHAARLVERAREEGLLLNAPRPSTIRLMPPLVVTDSDITEFAARLERALRGMA